VCAHIANETHSCQAHVNLELMPHKLTGVDDDALSATELTVTSAALVDGDILTGGCNRLTTNTEE